MGKRLTHEEFVTRVKETFGDEYVFLEPYKNTRTKIKCKHKKCGRTWNANPTSFLTGHGCTCKLTKSQALFDQELAKVHGDDYSVLEPYQGATTKRLTRHNKCGYEWYVVPTSLLRGYGCPKCRALNNQVRAGKRLKRRINEDFNGDYELLSEYDGYNSKVIVEHKVCGNKFSILSTAFTKNKTEICPYCRISTQKLSQKDFDMRVSRIVGDAYTFLEPYKGATTKIRCRHNKCEEIFSITPSSFFRGVRCIGCGNKERHEKVRNKERTKFINELSKQCGNRIVLIGEWVNSTTLTIFYDVECGTWYKALPTSVKKSDNFACPKCRPKSKPKSDFKFKKDVFSIYGDEYTFLEKYQKATIKIKCQHNKCGFVWKVKPNNFLTGYGCPRCCVSQGEKTIERWLLKNGYNYNSQKIFVACRDKNPLPFDFYLPDYNLLIEYDGEQHYKPSQFFGGEEAYKIRHKHDLIKNKYCEDNNINLLRIPYTVTGEDIGKVIQNKLDELKQLDNVA